MRKALTSATALFLVIAAVGCEAPPTPPGCPVSGSATTLAASASPELAKSIYGELEVVAEWDGVHTEIHHHLKRDDGSRMELELSERSAAGLGTTGSRVRVSGDLLEAHSETGDQVLVGQAEVIQAVLPRTFGTQKTLVMMVNWGTEPWTKATEEAEMDKVRRYVEEASYGQTSLAVTVAGWFTIDAPTAYCSASGIASAAKSAARSAGYDTSAFSRLIYVFPKVSACSWRGLGTVGGNPSESWINGTYSGTTTAHELGHNFGLYHSQSRDCGSVALSTSCSDTEYGDTTDVMGQGGLVHYSSYQKERLGWLGYGSSPMLNTVTSSGSFVLSPLSQSNGGIKALKIPRGTDSNGYAQYLYVEYRPTSGFDSFSSSGGITNGVVIHLGSEGSGRSLYLLDMTPQTSSWTDPALGVGKSFTDSKSGATISTTSLGSGGVVVSVDIQGSTPTCVRSNPTISVAGAGNYWDHAGGAATYTLSVKNNDSPECGMATFNLGKVVPELWTASMEQTHLTMAPGDTGTATLEVTSASTAAIGTYTISVSATNSVASSYTASATGSYGINAGNCTVAKAK